MGGLSSSRHAPHRALQNGSTTTNSPLPSLTLTPTPIDSIGDSDPPPPPTASTVANRASKSPQRRRPPPSALHELARYTKIVRRLQWKLPFLAQGYRQAVDRTGADRAAVSEAELMFRLDFFEYYMLIERALVHLLGVFGVDIPRGNAPLPHTDNEGGGGGGDGEENNKEQHGLAGSVWSKKSAPAAQHRYHANVLAALDRVDNPLHGTLGVGDVRFQLGRAKGLRNRWKTAGDDDELEHHGQNHERPSPALDSGGPRPGREWRTRKIAAPLDTYRLEHMLEVVFEGFDKAFKAAEQYVRGDLEAGAEGDADMTDWAAAADDEDQWKFMVDAMDWEAV